MLTRKQLSASRVEYIDPNIIRSSAHTFDMLKQAMATSIAIPAFTSLITPTRAKGAALMMALAASLVIALDRVT
jgi:hypothetical protein